jgi:transcription initiation factor TFIID TATA-box-binding protein
LKQAGQKTVDMGVEKLLQQYSEGIVAYQKDIEKKVEYFESLYEDRKTRYNTNENYRAYKVPEIKVVNIVVSTFLQNVDIEKVKQDMNTEYYPKQFPGVVHRSNNPKAAMLLFKTGKVICTGVRQIEDSYKMLNYFCTKFDTKYDDINVQNLVISVDFGYNIDLEDAVNSIPRSIYESEQFPGIIHRNTEPKAVFLIFTSGRCICVGTSRVEDAFEAIFQLRKRLIDNDLLIERQ